MAKESPHASTLQKAFDGPRWFVIHTKPRCEKKFAGLLSIELFEHYLPLITSKRRYGNRDRVYEKPLFPGYVFAEIAPEKKNRIYTLDLVVRTLWIDDQAEFLTQLGQIRTLVASGVEATLQPLIKKGARVRINSGPLWGVEGFVEDPQSPKGVLIAMDVLRQGVLVPVKREQITVLEETI